MRSLSLTPAILLLLAAASGGCSGASEPAQRLVPGAIAYDAVDRRHFSDVGRPVRTLDGAVLFVEAFKADTLLWFEGEADGLFRQAFLRRGNTVYALGRTGDYMIASAPQSALYSLFLEQWRTAQQ